MYDKKKTLSSYMGGGYMNPMGYAKGGYRKGLSSVLYRAGLNRDKQIAQEEFEEQAKKLEKEQYWRGVGKTLGKVGGTALGALLAAPTGGLSIAAGRALGATLGTAAGGAIGGSGQDASNIKDSSTGLYKDDFEYLREQGRKAESFKRLGQESAIAGGTTYLGAKSGDIVSGGKKFIGDKFGAESLENLGLAGKTDPLFSSLNQDVAKAKAGAEFVIGDESSLYSDIANMYGEKQPEGLMESFVDADAVRPDAMLIKDFNMDSLLAEQYADSPADQAYESLQSRKQAQFDVYNKDPNSELIRGIDSSPLMSYEDSLKGSNRLGNLNTKIADINEGEVLRNQTSSKDFNQFIKNMGEEFGDTPSAQKYKDRALKFEEIIQMLESGTEGEKPLASLENLIQSYPEQSSLTGNSSDLEFLQAYQRKIRGYSKGGMYNGYKSGGLINMKQFGRRIL